MEQDLPSQEAIQIANNITNLGQMYNREDASTDILVRRNVNLLILVMAREQSCHSTGKEQELTFSNNSTNILGKGSSSGRGWSEGA